MADAQVRGISYELSASSQKAIQSLEKISSALNSIKGNKLSRELNKIVEALDSFNNEKISKLNKVADAIKTLGQNGSVTIKIKFTESPEKQSKEVEKLNNALIKVQETSQEIMPIKNAIVPFSKNAIEQIKEQQSFADSLKDRLRSQDIIDDEYTEKKPTQLKKPPVPDEKDIKNTKAYANALKLAEKAMDGLKKVARVTLSVMQKTGSVFASIGKVIGNQLFGGIQRLASAYENLRRRIATVFLRRVITAALRAIYSAMQEGVNNMYQFSQTARQSFVTAMDSIATSALYAKNSLGAMLAPAIEALAPVIDFIIDKFVALLNVINQVLSILGGKAFWTKAVKQATSFGDAASGSAGKVGKAAKQAAEDLKLFLAPWDELHLTPEPDKPSSSGSGGGGGGGAGGLAYETMFENASFDEQLKNLIEKGDWYKVGQLFAEKLNIITKKADEWITKTFTPWAKKFANKLGNLINGFVDNYNCKLLGKTIGDGFNGVIGALEEWWRTTNFLNLGYAIGDAIMSWFNTVDWKLLSNYFVEKTNGIADYFTGLVYSIFGGNNPKNIANKITEAITNWFNNVKWRDLGTTLTTLFNGVVDMVTTFAKDGEMWKSIKNGLETVFTNLKNLKVGELASSLSTIFVNAMKSVKWDVIGQKIGEFLSNLKWGEIITTMLSAGWSLIKGAFTGFIQGEHSAELAGILLTAIAGAIALKTLAVSISMQVTAGAITHALTSSGIATALGGTAIEGTGLLATIMGGLGKAGLMGLALVGGVLVSTFVMDIVYKLGKTIFGFTDEDVRKSLGDPTEDNGFNRTIRSSQIKVEADTEIEMDITGRLTNLKKGKDLIPEVTGLTAIFGKWNKDKSFSNNIKDLIANFTKSKKDTGFNSNLSMISQFSKWIKGDKFNNNVGMTSQLNGWVKGAKFGTSIGMTSLFKSWNKANTFSNSIGNLTAQFKTWSKASTFSNTITGMTASLSASALYTRKKDGGVFDGSKWHPVNAYAGGGFTQGQFFVAREAGPELVGTIGGNTAVMNNNQIVSSVAAGVAHAVASVMGGGNQNITVYLDGEVVYNNVVNRNNDKVARTGKSDLMV